MTIEVQESSSTALNWLGMFLSDVLWECKVNAYLSAGHPRPKRRSTNPAFQFAGRRQFLLMLFCDPTNRLGQCVCFARSRSPPPAPAPASRAAPVRTIGSSEWREHRNFRRVFLALFLVLFLLFQCICLCFSCPASCFCCLSLEQPQQTTEHKAQQTPELFAAVLLCILCFWFLFGFLFA